jgi:hypothetical protein
MICPKKVPTNPDYVWSKKPSEMNGYGDIWFFDLNYCDVDKYVTDKLFNFLIGR